MREQLFKKRQRLNGNTINRGLTADFPVHGSPKIPVILVQFPDKKLKNSNPVAQFQAHFNTKDKSVAQYFSDQSSGDFTPQFDVFGPYTTVNNRAYYGANDPNGVGGACHLAKAIGEMIVEACTALDDEIDFSQYDYDGDGFCNALTIIFARVEKVKCPECYITPGKCIRCYGSGKETVMIDVKTSYVTCTACNGTGVCPTCHGTKMVKKKH